MCFCDNCYWMLQTSGNSKHLFSADAHSTVGIWCCQSKAWNIKVQKVLCQCWYLVGAVCEVVCLCVFRVQCKLIKKLLTDDSSPMTPQLTNPSLTLTNNLLSCFVCTGTGLDSTQVALCVLGFIVFKEQSLQEHCDKLNSLLRLFTLLVCCIFFQSWTIQSANIISYNDSPHNNKSAFVFDLINVTFTL